jgi:hypothetical protein
MEVHPQAFSFVLEPEKSVQVVVELLQPAVWVYPMQQPDEVAQVLPGPAVVVVLVYVLQSMQYK